MNETFKSLKPRAMQAVKDSKLARVLALASLVDNGQLRGSPCSLTVIVRPGGLVIWVR